MIPEVWNEATYAQFIEYLNTIKEEEYKNFHSSLIINCKYELLGIRLPIMRKIAKEISKTDVIEFLNVSQDNYYEEIMIQGLVIALIKDEAIFNKYFSSHIKKIDNWALCDTFCNSVKIVERYEDKYFKIALELALREEEFLARVGLIIILSFFIKEKNLGKIFEVLNKITSDKYYINMAEAWLLCEIYIKYKDESLKFIENNKLNKFTQNKTISKICDSYRVTKEEKECLKKLRKV